MKIFFSYYSKQLSIYFVGSFFYKQVQRFVIRVLSVQV